MNESAIAKTALLLLDNDETTTKQFDPVTGEVFTPFDPHQIDYYGKLLNELELREGDYASKEEIYRKKKKSAQNSIEWLKSRLQQSMRTAEQSEIVGNEYRFLCYSSGKKVVVTDENQIPEEFFLQKISATPNKELIKKVLIEGHDLPGVHLENITIFKVGVK